jgi:hypothetical protein
MKTLIALILGLLIANAWVSKAYADWLFDSSSDNKESSIMNDTSSFQIVNMPNGKQMGCFQSGGQTFCQ